MSTKTRGILPTETVFSHPQFFGVTQATPAQRAICRAIDGLPIPDALWEYEDRRYAEFGGIYRVKDIFGGVRPTPGVQPKLIVLLGGIRGGKSTLISAVAAKAALWGADLDGQSPLKPKEKARVAILSSQLEIAQATYEHMLGGFEDSPILRKRLVGEAKNRTFSVRHESNRTVDIRCLAQGKEARTLTSRWNAAVVIDEAPRQASGEAGLAVNIESQISGVWGRIRPGGQILLPGSPVGPSGYVYTLHSEHFGKPDADYLVIQCPGYLLNPSWWTVEECRKFQESRPDDFQCEVLAQFRGNDNAMYPPAAVDHAAVNRIGLEVLDPAPGARYVAAIDPATRRNAFTLVVGTIDRDNYVTVALAKEWIGTSKTPLSPAEIFREIAALVEPYGVREIWSDLHHFDANKDHARDNRLQLSECSTRGRQQYEMYADLRERFLSGQISIPPDQNMRADLMMVRKRVTPRGEPTAVLQQGSNGRHCDYAAALAILNHKLTYT